MKYLFALVLGGMGMVGFAACSVDEPAEPSVDEGAVEPLNVGDGCTDLIACTSNPGENEQCCGLHGIPRHGTCRDLNHDAYNCGACGNVCGGCNPPLTPTCVNTDGGHCICT